MTTEEILLRQSIERILVNVDIEFRKILQEHLLTSLKQDHIPDVGLVESDWIENCSNEISRIELPRLTCKSNIKKIIQKHLTQKDDEGKRCPNC
jgi:hypothetical protein